MADEEGGREKADRRQPHTVGLRLTVGDRSDVGDVPTCRHGEGAAPGDDPLAHRGIVSNRPTEVGWAWPFSRPEEENVRKWVLVAAVAGTALFLAGSAVGALASKAAFAWMSGDESAYVGRPEGTSDLELFAGTDLNALANHIRLGGRDGNFEFEHAATREVSHLNAYVIGTNTRTPFLIGGDEQDVTALIINGKPRQTRDLQQWTTGGQVRAAIDGQGRLRLGSVRLVASVQNGRAVLTAVLPNGKKQVLAAAH